MPDFLPVKSAEPYINTSQFSSISGCDIHAAIVVSDDIAEGTENSARYKIFADIQTISITSHRGVAPVRRLGESFVYDYARGTRTIAGTVVFTMLNTDTLKEVYAKYARETSNGPFTYFTDQLPPFNIIITARNEMPYSDHLTMALIDVTLVSNGRTLSIDDIYTETTYNYVARWATPFISLSDRKNLRKLLNFNESHIDRALSSL